MNNCAREFFPPCPRTGQALLLARIGKINAFSHHFHAQFTADMPPSLPRKRAKFAAISDKVPGPPRLYGQSRPSGRPIPCRFGQGCDHVRWRQRFSACPSAEPARLRCGPARRTPRGLGLSRFPIYVSEDLLDVRRILDARDDPSAPPRRRAMRTQPPYRPLHRTARHRPAASAAWAPCDPAAAQWRYGRWSTNPGRAFETWPCSSPMTHGGFTLQ